ncbi:rac GTPase-activating protein 1 isoform X2 [Oncorhynchus tshawytscha]|uniref:Rac GTPase-activating protein 1-like n=1 Tax=Oncorhynchus tshawytscha TaxID=74940 RepID=A0A8C8G172_ONCTS|nr:rac GTPase-activating protein 1 isoform X2 [Oncorhynchus tshawytscha]
MQTILSTSEMGEAFIRELLSLCLQRIAVEENAMNNTELEFIEVVNNYDATRKKWLHAELELKRHKALLLKSDIAQAALEVKLKHCRNQVDVEIKKRYKAEADFQYLQRQMQLMCDILVHDSKSNACLNDEQRSLLANFNHRGANVTQHKSKRLSVIDESSFLSHSDISYDRTDDDMDLDVTAVKPLKSRAREKRRSSMGPTVGAHAGKRGRVGGRSDDLLERRPMEKEVETTIVTASVTTPESGGQIHMVIDITQETPEKLPRTYRKEHQISSVGEQTSVWTPNDETAVDHDTTVEPDTMTEMESTTEPRFNQVFTPTVSKTLRHYFLSKTVIRPETCVPCGKRIRFGKMAVKCRDCRVVAHPECKPKCLESCPASCGAHGAEKGIYRVPGGERMVKALRERYINGKRPLMLSRVDEIHVVCGLLKDFLRKLKEPLITFRLHRTFMEACEIPDDDDSTAIMYRAIGDLPKPNRETLAFLMLHLQRVMQSPLCQMDKNNLSRVFGPTIVGHGMAEPSPMTIMRDTNIQPMVIGRMLSFPAEYWKRLIMVARDQVISSVVDANINSESHSTDRDRLFKPLTSPELSKYPKTPTSGSLKGRMKNAFNNTNRAKTDPGKNKFFTSPN